MSQDIVQLPHQHIAHLEGEDLKHAIERNFKEVAQMLYFLQLYEKKTGKPINKKVDGVIDENGKLITGMLSEKMVGLQNELELADEAVTAAKLAVAAVVAEKIKDGEVAADKIAANAITAVKIATGAVITEKIAAGAITADKIGVNELSAISAYLGTIIGGEIYGTRIRTGTPESDTYIELSPSFEIVRNGEKYFEISYWEGPELYFLYEGDIVGKLWSGYDSIILSSYQDYPIVLAPSAIQTVDIYDDHARWRQDQIDYDGIIVCSGLYVVGGPKDAVIETENYGWIEYSAVEAPDVRFEDKGIGKLENGRAVIELNDILLESIEPHSEQFPWIIQLTPCGPYNLYVDKVTDTTFEIKSIDETATGDFYWHFSAIRKGFAREKFKEADFMATDNDIEEYLKPGWEDDLFVE